jgi:alpha-1,2-mannosyltransferase
MFLACGAIGYLAAPSASTLYWTKVFYDAKRAYPAYLANQSISGAALRVFGSPAHVNPWYLPLTLVAAVVGLGAAAVFARRHDWLSAMAATGITGLLISPVSWTHHWVDAIPALIVLASGGKRARIAAACAFAMFALTPLWWTPHSLLQPVYGFHGLVTVVANCYVLAGLAFLAYMARQAWQARQTPETGQADPRSTLEPAHSATLS